jgi:hypothetical protein
MWVQFFQRGCKPADTYLSNQCIQKDIFQTTCPFFFAPAAGRNSPFVEYNAKTDTQGTIRALQARVA